MARDIKVNLFDVEEVLKDEISLNNLFPCKKPSVVFITGVSGSGKSTIISNLQGNFIKIQPDNYRKLHPKISEFLVKLGRSEAYKKTGNYSFNFAKSLCEKSIENHLNIIFEATFSKFETAKSLINPFLEKGYNVLVVKLPIDVNLSIERNNKRYKEKQAQAHTIPRITSKEDIEKMAFSYENTLIEIGKLGINIVPFSEIKDINSYINQTIE